MITIETLVEQGANVKLEITPSDLKMFAESIVQRTILATRICMPSQMYAACRQGASPKV